MMIKLYSRTETSYAALFLSPILAFILTIISLYFLFLFININPSTALNSLFIEPLSQKYTLSELFLKTTPLLIIATGLSLGFKAGIWNIGAEGQYAMGAVAGGAVALIFYDISGYWVLPLMCLAGIVGGCLYASIAAFLKTYLNVNEILVTLMLSYVAILFLSAMVHGPLKDPDGFNFPESRLLHDSAILPIIWSETRLHIGFIIAIGLALLSWLFLKNHITGFQIETTGASSQAAKFAGFNNKKTIWGCFIVSGGLAGLAGIFETAGPMGQLVPHIPAGYGFTAIIVAFLGRLHPIGIIFSSLLVALTYIGGEQAQIALNLPLAITQVFQGMLLFYFLACEVFIKYKIVIKHKI